MFQAYRQAARTVFERVRRSMTVQPMTSLHLRFEQAEARPLDDVESPAGIRKRDVARRTTAAVSYGKGWSVTSACVAGERHTKRGAPCQDALAFTILDDFDALVIAVSDGAGSARFSEHGANTAVRTVCAEIEAGLRVREPAGMLIQKAFGTALLEIERYAQKLVCDGVNCSLRDFACTLIVTVLQRDRLLMAQIGDGAVVLQRGLHLECISVYENGEYVNETQFITMKGMLEKLRVTEHIAEDLTSLALMTDGVQHVAISSADQKPFHRFFNPIFEYALRHAQAECAERNAALVDFLQSAIVNAETDDDKTLILAVRA